MSKIKIESGPVPERIRMRVVRAQRAEADSKQALAEWRGEPIARGQDQTLETVASERGRSCDLAKRRKVVVLDILEAPQNFPLTDQNKGIVVRQFERLIRFARTLRNKGRLNPKMASILEIEEKRSVKASVIERAN
jgi:hypothetical protein